MSPAIDPKPFFGGPGYEPHLGHLSYDQYATHLMVLPTPTWHFCLTDDEREAIRDQLLVLAGSDDDTVSIRAIELLMGCKDGTL